MKTMDDTNRRLVMRILLLGFGLVLLVLGLATFVAVRDNALRTDAAKLVKEHLANAQLLREVQAQEDVLSLGLHRMNSSADAGERRERCDDLVAAVAVVKTLAQQASATPEGSDWARLAEASQRFTELATTAMQQHSIIEQQAMEQMFSQHDTVVKMIHDLVQRNTLLWLNTDEQMQLEMDDLADDSLIMLIACFLLAMVFAGATVLVVRKGIHRIEWQRDELSRVSWHMLQTQEDTARRFSHEMHDELGQSLAAVRANLTGPTWMDEERREDSVQLVDEAIANVRELSQLLRPVILDDFGLEAALRWLADRFAQRTRIGVTLDCSLTERLEHDTETHLFRIAQEALTNIARHSQAKAVLMSLVEKNEQLWLTVQDNGVGIPAGRQETSASLGLIGMRARARECGGVLKLESAIPSGVKISVCIPRRGGIQQGVDRVYSSRMGDLT